MTRVGAPVRIVEGSTEVAGDAPTGSRTGMRLPTRYSFSWLGACAVEPEDEVLEVLAQPARANTRARTR